MNKSAKGLFRICRRSGFTLIELLIVVAIIAVLASLLLPALSVAKSSGMFARCKSNLRQLGIGLTMYVSDFNAYPLDYGGRGNTSGYGLERWNGLLEPYVQRATDSYVGTLRKDMFECPSNEGIRQLFGNTRMLMWKNYGLNAYGYNPKTLLMLGIAGTGSFGSPPTRESDVVAPSNMIAIGDATANGPTNSVGTASDLLIRADRVSWGDGESLPRIRQLQQRHRGRINLVFCDSHIEGFNARKLFLDKSDNALRRWNRDNEPHKK